MRVGDILPNPFNPKIHPENQLAPLRGLLETVGKLDDLKAYHSERAGGALVFFDGHGRQALDPDAEWDVDVYDLSDAEADLAVATFDPIGWQAEQSRARLDELLREVSTGNEDLLNLLTKQAEDAGIVPGMGGNAPGAGGDDFDTTPEETQTRVRCGDLWICGEHRVLCGDSTKAEDVVRVMAGEKADMVFTDPPYGVSYGSAKKGAISGDLSQVAIPLSFKTAVEVATTPEARLYYCGGSTNCPMYFSLFDSYCQQMPHLLIWVKESFVMRPNNYHSQFEVIYFGWKGTGGGAEFWFGDRKASDIWQVSRDKIGDYLHPTQKPIEIPMRAIGYSAPPDGIVFEPFGGSGSTLIACERANRKARVIEIEPKYVNVILSRWEAETGKKAQLLERLDG